MTHEYNIWISDRDGLWPDVLLPSTCFTVDVLCQCWVLSRCSMKVWVVYEQDSDTGDEVVAICKNKPQGGDKLPCGYVYQPNGHRGDFCVSVEIQDNEVEYDGWLYK
jgi:hypothetical protein